MQEAVTTLWLFGNHTVTAAVVLGLFWAATARPSRIRKPAAFRWSALLVGLAFVTNVLIPLTVIVSTPEDHRGRSQGPRDVLYFLVIPPVLVMFAIYLGVESVMERAKPTKAEPYSGPRKLDRRLSYTGGPRKGKRWQASVRVTR
jgi:hypothetical protein